MRVEVDAGRSTTRLRRRTGSRPCAPRFWCWGRCWRAVARPMCRCRWLARSARARSTCISRVCGRWVPRSRSRGYIKARQPSEGRAPGARSGHGDRHREPDDGRPWRTAHAAGKRGARPEVVDLANCLNAMGARIAAPVPRRSRSGVKRHGTQLQVLPDRIETGTFLVAGAISGGKVRVRDTDPPTRRGVACKAARGRCRARGR